MKTFLISLGLASAIVMAGCSRIEFKDGADPAKLVKKTTSKLKEKARPKRKFDTLTQITNYASVTPAQIITRAHGYAVFYKDGQSLRHESHKMWRIYDASKTNAHQVDGKVRIHSVKDGEAVINISYDGHSTYTDKGAKPKTAADKGWSSNFGFGVIRHALDTGYALERLPDDMIDGKPAFMVKVLDPSGGETTFGIGHNDYKILKVGFETARGWHERIYSDFYSNPGDEWLQPGRVRLYYDGEKSNEVIWERYAINQELPDCLFVLPQAVDCR